MLPNIIIYATFGISYWCGCKCRRDRGPAKSIAIYGVLGQGCFNTSLFTSFWQAGAPKHAIIYATFAFSYWFGCKPRRDPPPAKSIATYGVLGQGCSKTSVFTCFLGGQCFHTQLFTQHLPSHTGAAVSLVEIRLQPKASLFKVFWARVAPKHCYLQASGRPVRPKHNYLHIICPLIVVRL